MKQYEELLLVTIVLAEVIIERGTRADFYELCQWPLDLITSFVSRLIPPSSILICLIRFIFAAVAAVATGSRVVVVVVVVASMT